MNKEEGREKLRGRASFLFPKAIMPLIGSMTNSGAGEFIKMALWYVVHFEIPEKSGNELVDATFNVFKEEYDRESLKYIETCRKNSEIAKKRWKGRD